MTRRAQVLLYMGALFAAMLVAANAAGGKIIAVGPLAASATVFAYALSFPITDTISEIFGKRAADQVVIVGFFCVLMAVGFYQVALIAPPAAFFEDNAAFETVFQTSWRLLLGGLCAYLVSQFLDIRLFHLLSVLTKGRHLWLRNNGSTLISQLVDTSIFITIAFYGVVDNIGNIILGQYVIKIVIAAIDTPVVYLAVFGIRRWIRE